jgi:hypothetical protein
MRILFILLSLLTPGLRLSAQDGCIFGNDTLTAPGTSVRMEGESISVPLKGGGSLLFFKTSSGKAYLRIEITENFYFGRTDLLEIRSGSKSFYSKNAVQQKVHKGLARFTVEIFRNYLYTLKDLGITGITFAGADTDFSRQDNVQIRKAAACFYDTTKN